MVANRKVRETRPSEDAKDRAGFLSKVARSDKVPDQIAARCGHRALRLHFASILTRERLLRRQEVLSLCDFCGHRLDGDGAEVRGKALRTARRRLRRSSGGRRFLLRAVARTCELCGKTKVLKTFKTPETSAR